MLIFAINLALAVFCRPQQDGSCQCGLQGVTYQLCYGSGVGNDGCYCVLGSVSHQSTCRYSPPLSRRRLAVEEEDGAWGEGPGEISLDDWQDDEQDERGEGGEAGGEAKAEEGEAARRSLSALG